MTEFNIKGKKINLDESKTYLDFFKEDGKPQLVQLDMKAMLSEIQDRKIPLNEDLKRHLNYLARWIKEAPRKRHFREMRMSGFTVLSGEYFFDNMDNGAQIIDDLENTGNLCQVLLKELFNSEYNDKYSVDYPVY